MTRIHTRKAAPYPRRPVPATTRRKVEADLRKGLGVSTVANKYHLQWKTADRIRMDAGIPPRLSGVNNQTTPAALVKRIQKRLKDPDRAGDELLGKEFGVGRSVVRRIRERMKIEALPKGGSPKKRPPEDIAELIKSRVQSVRRLAAANDGDESLVIEAIDLLKREGFNVIRAGDRVEVLKNFQQSWTGGAAFELLSDKNNRFHFGATGDWHVGSKYFRDDVLADIYKRFAEEGVRDVFHTGNWIDGEAKFNRYDLTDHGFDAQVKALARAMPKHKGITTHAVWGDDHEGWYAQQMGINVGGYAEQIMRAEGRTDWHDLGFMEAHVILRNANTGISSVMVVAHPGGGSSYATSYKPQKIVESLEGGEKPAILLIGHYHKFELINVRNVWVAQTGAVQDQTPFLRKKSIEVHIGAAIVSAEQDPKTGAIIELNGMRRYFNREYYAGERWSHHGKVGRAARTPGGI